MRFKTWKDVDAAGYVEGPLYRIDTIVFNIYIDRNGKTCMDDADFWYNERLDLWAHPFDCFFTDLDEARLYCNAFTSHMADWTLRTCNDPRYENVAVDVIEMYRIYDEWAPGMAVSTYDFLEGGRYEEWHDWDVAEKGLECKV